MTQSSIGKFLSDLFLGNRPAWLVASDPMDRLATFLLALAFSTWWLAISVILQFALGIPYKLRLYLLFAVLVPVVVIGTVLLIQRLKQSLNIPQGEVFYEPLLAFDGFFILLAVLTAVPVLYDVRLVLAYVVAFALGNGFILWRLVGVYRNSLSSAERQRSIRLSLILASLGAVVIVGTVYGFGNLDTRSWYVNAEVLFPVSGVLLIILPVLLVRHIYRVIPWIAGLTIALFVRRYVSQVGVVLPVSMAVAIVPAILIKPRPAAEGRRPFSWLEGLIVIWLLLIVVNLYFPSDRLHYNALLAHVNDVIHGKTLMVDTHPQYGVGLTYFLSALFGIGILPLSYSAFSLVNSLLIVGQGGLLYVMLRMVVKSRWIPALAVTIMAAMVLWQVDFISLYLPSGGPIRFLPIYILLTAIAFRLRYPGRRWMALEYLALLLCAGWSLETLVYGSVVYLAIRLFEIAIMRLPISESIARTIRLAPPIIAAVVLPLLAVEVGTYLRSGQWPAWQIYAETLRYYGTEAKPYQLAITFWSEWIFVLGVCLGSLLLLGLKFFYSSRPEELQPYILPFGMTVWGVVQFSYFVAEPSVITNVILPTIFLVAYWFSKVHTGSIRSGFSVSMAYLVYVVLLFELVTAGVLSSPELNATPLALIVRKLIPAAQPGESFDLAARWDAPPEIKFFRPPDVRRNSLDGLVAVDLIKRYASGKDRIVVLIAPDSSNEALLTTHKVDIFPLGDVKDQSYSPTSNKRALEFPHSLVDGDIVFIDIRMTNLLPVQTALVGRLCQQFSLHPVEVSQSGVAALRLGPAEETAGSCTCGTIELSCP